MADFEDVSPMQDVADNPANISPPTTFELDVYASSYEGSLRIRRLQFIADRCPQLRVEALKLAVETAKQGINIPLINLLFNQLTSACEKTGIPVPLSLDKKWLDDLSYKVHNERERLENDFKRNKSSQIRESLRTTITELGDHYFNCGDIGTALKHYVKLKDFNTTPRHHTAMLVAHLKCGMEQGNWALVQSTNLKLSKEEAKDTAIAGMFRAATGISYLAERNYKEACRAFTKIPFEQSSSYPWLASGRDIAVYGALSALCVLSRGDLKKAAIDDPDVKQFLEGVPEIRELVRSFYNSRFASCLAVLSNWKNDLLVDIYVSKMAADIVRRITDKAIVQYCSPFLSVDMVNMATAFNVSFKEMEASLIRLIQEKQIAGRIDSDKQVLHARRTDVRQQAYAHALASAVDYNLQAKAFLIRAAMLKANIMVKADNVKGQNNPNSTNSSSNSSSTTTSTLPSSTGAGFKSSTTASSSARS